MNKDMKLGQDVTLSFSEDSKLRGQVQAIERNEDDSVAGVLIQSPQVADFGTLYFDTDEITLNGWKLEALSEEGVVDADLDFGNGPVLN